MRPFLWRGNQLNEVSVGSLDISGTTLGPKSLRTLGTRLHETVLVAGKSAEQSECRLLRPLLWWGSQLSNVRVSRDRREDYCNDVFVVVCNSFSGFLLTPHSPYSRTSRAAKRPHKMQSQGGCLREVKLRRARPTKGKNTETARSLLNERSDRQSTSTKYRITANLELPSNPTTVPPWSNVRGVFRLIKSDFI